MDTAIRRTPQKMHSDVHGAESECIQEVSGEYLLDIAQLVCNTPMCGAVCAGQITEGAERISQRNRCTNVPSHARVIR